MPHRPSCGLLTLRSSQTAPALQGNVAVKDPLARFFERECALATKLLQRIRTDLTDLVQVCDGSLKQTNDIRILLSDLTKGTVPLSWRRYRCRDLAAGAWIADLSKRLAQLAKIVAAGDLGGSSTSLGLLFHPHGFVTASRQAVAHATKSSLEQLSLRVSLEQTGGVDSFTIEGALSLLSDLRSYSLTRVSAAGLALVGASWSSAQLVLNDGSTVRLGASQISWVRKEEETSTSKSNTNEVEIPCWLDATRADSLFTVKLDAGAIEPSVVAQRAVALVAALD